MHNIDEENIKNRNIEHFLMAGKYLSTGCPYHPDTTPSCIVDIRTMTFRCRGCGASGSISGAILFKPMPGSIPTKTLEDRTKELYREFVKIYNSKPGIYCYNIYKYEDAKEYVLRHMAGEFTELNKTDIYKILAQEVGLL